MRKPLLHMAGCGKNAQTSSSCDSRPCRLHLGARERVLCDAFQAPWLIPSCEAVCSESTQPTQGESMLASLGYSPRLSFYVLAFVKHSFTISFSPHLNPEVPLLSRPAWVGPPFYTYHTFIRGTLGLRSGRFFRPRPLNCISITACYYPSAS